MKYINHFIRILLSIIGGLILGIILASYVLDDFTSGSANPGDMIGAEVIIGIIVSIIVLIFGFAFGFAIVWLIIKGITNKGKSKLPSNQKTFKLKKKNIDSFNSIKKKEIKQFQRKEKYNTKNDKSKLSFFSEFLNTKSQLSKKMFFYRILILMLIAYVIHYYTNFDNSLNNLTIFDKENLKYLIFYVVSKITISILSLIQIIKKLNDISLSHWYIIIYFVPIANWIFLMFLSLKDGTIDKNNDSMSNIVSN